MADHFIRLNKVLRELNISCITAIDFLKRRKIIVSDNPNAKISMNQCKILIEGFCTDKTLVSKTLNKFFDVELLELTSHNSSLKVNEHKSFQIVEHKPTCTILKDELTDVTYSYKKLSKSISDRVIMQIVSLDNPEKPLLKYSALNDFAEDEEYDFDIVERKENGFVIENSEDFTSFIPLSYERFIDRKKIRLTVDKIDRVKNHLIFKSKDNFNKASYIPEKNGINASELFIKGEKYTFKIEGFRVIDNDISIILLDYRGFKATVKAFSFQNIDNLPEAIICSVGQVSDNKVNLFQDKSTLYAKLYKEGNKYAFTINSIENDLNSNSKYLAIKDEYHLLHKLYKNDFENEEFEEFTIGQIIALYVRRIDERGYLVLSINPPERKGEFATVESVFTFINKLDSIDKYFYNLKEEIKKNIYLEQPYSQLYEDYNKKENLWVFSYLSFLNEFIQNLIKENQIQKAVDFSDIYLEIEEWMLEGSNFLQKFSQEKRPTIIRKAEAQLKQAKIRKEALLLIINNESEKYIQDTLRTLRLSSYLRDEKINVFKSLIFNVSFSNLKNTKEIVEIILLLNKGDLLDTYDIINFIGALEHKINVEKYDLNPILLSKELNSVDEETHSALNNIIKILGLQIILNSKIKNHELAVLKSAIMCRYLSYLSTDENAKLKFLNKAINCIVNSKILHLKNEVVADFDINIVDNLSAIDEHNEKLKEIIGNQVYSNNGGIYSTGSGWSLLSRHHHKITRATNAKLFTLKSFFNGGISIASPYELDFKLDSHTKITDCNKNWRNLYKDIEVELTNMNSLSLGLFVGQNVRVIAKNYLKNSTKVIFLKIIESDFEGEGIFTLNDAFRKNVDDLEDVINPGDEFTAEIISIDERGIAFTIANEIWTKTLSEINNDDVIDAKVMHIYGKMAFLITENGHFTSMYLGNTNIVLEVRKVYKFKVTDINYEKSSISLDYKANSERYFNEKTVLRSFLERTEIIRVSEIKEDNSKNIENLITEVINCIENVMHFEHDNLRKVEYLQLLKLLSSINKSYKSYYFETLINYFQNIYDFKELTPTRINIDFEPIDEKTIGFFKSLELINDRYKYLNLYNKADSIPNLIQLRNDVSDEHELKLIDMLLANNLMVLHNNDEIVLQRTHDLIFEFLSNEKVEAFSSIISSIKNDVVLLEKENDIDEIVLNLGREGTFREFKTSIIYYAGNNCIDIEKQSAIIMKTIAGFLNSRGGSLFIGVNDNGEIVGLQNDYLHFGKFTTNDKYEREIRDIIVKSFNKDINSHIEFKFLSSNNIEYCEIIIPEYDKAVTFSNNFYQRQGNETRILTGNDLISFFERKLQKNTTRENITFTVNRDRRNLDAESKEFQNNENQILIDIDEEDIDFYKDKKTENKQLSIDYITPNNNIIAYMYIFIDGKYILTNKQITQVKSAEEIVIYDNFKNGFLLQCYDNGCVNKVEVRTLLEKTLGRTYSNGFSLQGNLVGLFLIKEECLLQVNTTRSEVEYLKIFDTSLISTHSHLNLKGNNIVQEDFDFLNAFKIINKSHRENLKRLTYRSKQSLGIRTDKLSYKNEIKYLNTIE